MVTTLIPVSFHSPSAGDLPDCLGLDYSGVMGCGNLGFPEFANLEPIGGKLADYRVYTPQDAPERTCVPRNGVSG